MSLDRSLRQKNALVRHRNVLTRAERIASLQEQEKWQADGSVFGLPKVAHRKVATRKAPKAAEVAAAGGEAAGAPAAEGAAAAPAAAPAKKEDKGKPGKK